MVVGVEEVLVVLVEGDSWAVVVGIIVGVTAELRVSRPARTRRRANMAAFDCNVGLADTSELVRYPRAWG